METRAACCNGKSDKQTTFPRHQRAIKKSKRRTQGLINWLGGHFLFIWQSSFCLDETERGGFSICASSLPCPRYCRPRRRLRALFIIKGTHTAQCKTFSPPPQHVTVIFLQQVQKQIKECNHSWAFDDCELIASSGFINLPTQIYFSLNWALKLVGGYFSGARFMSARKERMLGIKCWQFWPTFHWSRASLFIYFLGCSHSWESLQKTMNNLGRYT